MTFIEFREALQKRFLEMTRDEANLFEVEVDKDELWNLYLDSFPKGTNEIYRERREYDCSCCRQFIKAIGNVVLIKDNRLYSIWELSLGDDVFQTVADALSAYIKSHPVTNVFISNVKKIGTDVNREILPSGKIKKWEHFYLELPDKFIFENNYPYRSINDFKGDFKATKNVFKRSLDEITEESIQTVLELISQNSLYRGAEWKELLTEFLQIKREYTELGSVEEKENFAWERSAAESTGLSRIRNHSIGTLLIDISEGMELDIAVTRYEKIVAPENYKRPKAIYTKKMLEDAKKQIEELGYLTSLQRRFATLDDISINNILFSNKDAQRCISDSSDIFASMEQDIAINPKKFSRVEEVSIKDFVNNILPTTKEVEILFENRHSANMVSLIAPQNMDSPTMFKWNNGFSWAYSGNIADSSIRENVKSAGGKVDGVLRFSIQWNDRKDDWDRNDLDAHCKEPNGHDINFSDQFSLITQGELDTDITQPKENVPAVENITYPVKDKIIKGKYLFYVHQYHNRGGKSGFRAEIEFDGEIYQFDYPNELRQDEIIEVAEISFDGETFSIKELLPSNMSVKEV